MSPFLFLAYTTVYRSSDRIERTFRLFIGNSYPFWGSQNLKNWFSKTVIRVQTTKPMLIKFIPNTYFESKHKHEKLFFNILKIKSCFVQKKPKRLFTFLQIKGCNGFYGTFDKNTPYG